MTRKGSSTRRSFIRKTGAALSAPLAAAAVAVPVRAAADPDPLAARLALLEDTHAIRALNQAFARQVSAGSAEVFGIDPSIGSVAARAFGEHDLVTVAADRHTATSVMHCTVEINTPIGPSCPLVEMAREQGGGVVRRLEAGVFEIGYVRRDEAWAIHHATYRTTPS
jgi:hypothetical protein